MPAEAVSLALAASVYPPALAAIIALGQGVEVRLRVLLFVLAAYVTVLVTGTIMLVLFDHRSVAREQILAPSAALYVAVGVALVLIAAHLRRPRRHPAESAEGPSRIDRYLGSRRLVVALGVSLYVIPSPIFAAAVKTIADTEASGAQKLIYLVEMLLIMLWLIELPMLMLLLFPASAPAALEAINAWFGRHGRSLAIFASAGLGVYFLLVGAIGLSGS